MIIFFTNVSNCVLFLTRRSRGRGRKNNNFEILEPLPVEDEKIEAKGIAEEELGGDEENCVHNFEVS